MATSSRKFRSNTVGSRGVLEKWILKLFGSPMTPSQVQDRIRLVADAASGKHVEQEPCSPPPVHRKMEQGLSEKVLKVLTIISAFVLILAVYDTFEYACCYDDEKRKTIREWLIHRIQRETTTASGTGRTSDSVTELSRLLDADESLIGPEEIALDTFSASTSTTQFATNVPQLTDDGIVIDLENGQLLS